MKKVLAIISVIIAMGIINILSGGVLFSDIFDLGAWQALIYGAITLFLILGALKYMDMKDELKALQAEISNNIIQECKQSTEDTKAPEINLQELRECIQWDRITKE